MLSNRVAVGTIIAISLHSAASQAQYVELSNIQANVLISDASTWTVATAHNLSASANGMTLAVGFNWNIYNVVNPAGEIDQLFVAVSRESVLFPIIYHGHPGGFPGASGAFSASFDLTGLPVGSYDLLIARMAATTIGQAVHDYLAGGGWTGKAADLRIVPEPTSVGLLLLGMATLRWRSRRQVTIYRSATESGASQQAAKE